MAHQQRQLRLILYGADRASVVTAAQPVALRSIHPKLHTATRSPDVQGMGKRRSAWITTSSISPASTSLPFSAR